MALSHGAVVKALRYNDLVTCARLLALMRRQRRRESWIRVLSFVALAWCIASCADTPASPTPSTAPVVVTPTALPPAVGTALAFVDALNTLNYQAMYDFLEESSRSGLDPAMLEQNFVTERATATALTVTYQLRGGILTEGNTAAALLVSAWDTTLVDRFHVTATMKLKFDGQRWVVVWSRDLILPGLSAGTLLMQREMPPRGLIYAGDGTELAVQQERLVLGVRRGLIRDADEEKAMLELLGEITGRPPEQIQARYARVPADWFVPIAELEEDALTPYSSRLAPFAAVSAISKWTRSYPNGDLAPHVVGYVGAISPDKLPAYRARGFAGDEQVGLSGVEGYMDATLAGQPGGRLYLLRDDGSFELIAERPVERGLDVTLTLSPTLQRAVQSILGERTGAAVVLDARTSAVLAMVSYPAFDNAIFALSDQIEQRQRLLDDPKLPLLNRAVQGAYPPGSAFKIVVMAAGLAERVVRPEDVFVDPGYWDGLGQAYRKTCWLQRGHGRITLVNGLSASCNVVFYEIGKRLDAVGQSVLPAYARRFGFGASTGIELAGELAGMVPDPNWKRATRGEVWTSGDTVNMSIGQGFILVTPLQVAQMTAAVANNGELHRPYLVARLSSPFSHSEIQPEVVGQLELAPAVLQAIRTGMERVTTDPRLGTAARQFAGFEYYIVEAAGEPPRIVPARRLTAAERSRARRLIVAGKSGTAQAPQTDAKPFAWFTAYAPADAPQVVVTVLLENAGEGSAQAGPLVRQIMEAYFGLPLSTPVPPATP
ncbi:MAG: penicillin-binding transpeptidase domain-containing protein [Anaerolineae bacterium]|nr:penicillin-binding transpeptidase domain-containing protein [Thermoflexales bacterium]MDW8406600.1 penicillin-binding transpeptidase domain-containing protein [Anaerolineae bacterium]